MSAAKTVTDESFCRDVLQADRPVLVDFWADWCGPCHMVAPVLEQIADEHSHRIGLVKVNVDENRELAMDFQVSSLPTIAVFVGGELEKRIVGAHPKASLLRELADYIA